MGCVDMSKEQIMQRMAEAGLKPPARGDFIFIHWDQLAMLLAHEREACAADADWCIQNHLEHFIPERIRARSNT